MIINLTPTSHGCGECTLCCKVMGIQEGDFHKPKDVWCPHAKKGHGCGIYATRPTKCADFQCLWLSGDGPSEKRPDRIHGFFTMTTDGKNLVLHEDPGYAGQARRAVKREIEHWLDQGPEFYVIVVCGTARSFFGDIRTFRRLESADTVEVVGARNITVR